MPVTQGCPTKRTLVVSILSFMNPSCTRTRMYKTTFDLLFVHENYPSEVHCSTACMAAGRARRGGGSESSSSSSNPRKRSFYQLKYALRFKSVNDSRDEKGASVLQISEADDLTNQYLTNEGGRGRQGRQTRSILRLHLLCRCKITFARRMPAELIIPPSIPKGSVNSRQIRQNQLRPQHAVQSNQNR